jgi:hypothetical protein
VPPDSFDQPTGEGGTKKMRPSRCLLGVIANRKGRWVRFRRKMSPLLAALPKCATAAPASRLARCTRSRSAGSAAAGQSAGDRGQVVEVGTGVLQRRVAASGIHTHKADDDEREQAANYNRCDSLVCHDLFPPRREQWHGYFRRPIPARDIPLAEAGTADPMLLAMFVVSEADAAAIRTAFEQRRRFPGILDNVQARECARIIAGWKPLPALPRSWSRGSASSRRD